MRFSNVRGLLVSTLFVAAAGFLAVPTEAAQLHVGGAMTSITPDRPIALDGQMYTRVATEVQTLCTATALAIEAAEEGQGVEQAILISCDIVSIERVITEAVRSRVQKRLPGFDVKKIIISATHTHTAPSTDLGEDLPPEAISPEEYREFLAEQLADVAVKAWEKREPAKVGWGLGHAVVAHNRRAWYADGHATMYGDADTPSFRGIEGYEDHAVPVLFFWDAEGDLLATAINVACPSQEVEHLSKVNADFWHNVRETLRGRYGEDFYVLGWAGAAGDQSPHLMFREKAEERMRKLRGLSRLEELARRVVEAWDEAYAGAKQDIRDEVPFVHKVKTIELPIRQVTKEEYEHAKAEVARLSKEDSDRPGFLSWNQRAVDRYENQTGEEVYPMELHCLRLGDIAIATNSFEFFTDYGIRIKARSPAVQTFIIQLAVASGGYVPTARAVRGGGYSAVVQSSRVGPQGARVLVEETVSLIKTMWK